MLLAVLAASGCATLPEHVAPRRIAAASDPGNGDWVRYRALRRDDYRGERPPPEVAAWGAQIGAATCARLRPARRAQLALRWVRTEDGEEFYEVTPQRLRFVAVMDRSCSWWNPRSPGLSAEYVLQHEQIHFALFELQARELNARLPEIKRRIRGRGATVEEATEQASEQLDRVIEEALDASLERNREFDEDTSLGQHPRRQERWWRHVQEELAR